MKINVLKILIFKQNNILCIVTKVQKKWIKVYHVWQPQKILQKKKAQPILRMMSVYLKVKK